MFERGGQEKEEEKLTGLNREERERRLPRPTGVYKSSTTTKPRRAIHLVSLMACVETASECVEEMVQSQAWCENASQEPEKHSSGSKAELSRGSFYPLSVDQGSLNLCKPGRNVLAVFQSSLDTQADPCSPPRMPETGEGHVMFGQGFSKHSKVEYNGGTERS